jgi:D-tyrosyl-tRNA(Tyr) deacylase
MRAVVQRVSQASVKVEGETVGEISGGVLVLLGVSATDTEADAEYLLDKILNLRIFEDADGKMNRSLLETGGGMLVVSQFTLYGDARKGRRPSFIKAAQPELADRLYRFFVARAREIVANVACGRFQAMMDVALVNNGPVTILLDSERQF